MVLNRSFLAGDIAPPCGPLVNRQGACLILVLRHLGDALITCAFIRALQSQNPSIAIDVLGRPQSRDLVCSLCRVHEYIEVEFPVFGHHRRDASTLRRTAGAMRQVRRHRYDFCINLIGDVRESAISRLTAAKWNIGPLWGHGHLFKKKMTDKCAGWFLNCGIKIPPDLAGYYDSLSFLARSLGLADPFKTESACLTHCKSQGAKPFTISLHPGASHPSRHWPKSKWRELIAGLHRKGYEMQLLGSKHERGELVDNYGTEIHEFGVKVITGGFGDLLAALSNSDLLVGMDSLAAHAAFATSVRPVVLHGSSDPRIMTPPGGVPLSAGNLCSSFPCNYQYPCRGGDREYVCCREISVSSVLTVVDSAFAGGIQ
jgi:ADP-heptose:LPS heptosyltransferase